MDMHGSEFAPSVANVRNALDHMMRAVECVFSDDDSRFGDSEEKRADYIGTMVLDACKHLKRACLDTIDDMTFQSSKAYNGLRREMFCNGDDILSMDAVWERAVGYQSDLRLRKDSTEYSFDRDLSVAKDVFESLRELDAVLHPYIGPFAKSELYSAEAVPHRSDIPDTVVCPEVLDAYRSYKESVMFFESRMSKTPYYSVQRAVVGFLGMVGDGCSRGADAFNHLVSAALESDLLFVDICTLSIGKSLEGFTQEDATLSPPLVPRRRAPPSETVDSLREQALRGGNVPVYPGLRTSGMPGDVGQDVDGVCVLQNQAHIRSAHGIVCKTGEWEFGSPAP